MAQRAYFVIADITGYTAFLTGSELEHAQDILKTLFNTLLDNIRPPLMISNFQGDAILTYAPEGSFLEGQTLLEIVENIYCEFARALELMHANTTCTCQACANIPHLDLKLFVHHGEYVLQDMRGREELSGPDVIIAHRMMKNDVKEKTGYKAYTLFTAAAVDALGLQDFTCEMKTHEEAYEHIGPVPMYAYCLKTMWEREREKRRVFIAPETAWMHYTTEVQAPPALVWECLSNPAYLNRILGVPEVRLSGRLNGRKGEGTVLHCVHGDSTSDFAVLDWKPFEYRTDALSGLPMGITSRMTTFLKPIETGTEVTWVFEMLTGRSTLTKLVARIVSPMFKRELARDYLRVGGALQEVVREVQGASAQGGAG